MKHVVIRFRPSIIYAHFIIKNWSEIRFGIDSLQQSTI